ncbi:hypothetical protein, partial [Pseudomonas indica]|uniref:hypothetical protein n=1 Tax=Pseudomonas indica TaxID=137658 RepID=UPI003FD515A7
AARDAGADLRTGADVVAVSPDGRVDIAGEVPESVQGRLVLSGVGPAVLAEAGTGASAEAASSPRAQGLSKVARSLPGMVAQDTSSR